ncbi:unnamed protein product [Sympodiomycopsis kandeliae]
MVNSPILDISRDAPRLIAYFSLITLALVPIYFGSFQSLRTPSKVLESRRKQRKQLKPPSGTDDLDEDEEDSDDEPAVSETLTSSDAWLFPVIGSVVLFSLYCVFKFLDRKWVDRVLGTYFGVVGFFAVFKAFTSITSGIVGYQKWRTLLNHKITITKSLSDKELEEERKEIEDRKKKDDDSQEEVPKGRIRTLLSLRLSTWNIAVLFASLIPLVAFHVSHHWLASNVIALSLAVNAISLMGLDSFLTGSIMLGGLFFYDIFWVFGTEVMVSVARNFEAGPIKILFPKNVPQVVSYYSTLEQAKIQPLASTNSTLASLTASSPVLQRLLSAISSAPTWQMTMLGLGDIVIPGIYIALALRFDQHLYLRSLSAAQLNTFTRRDTSFAKPYFTATLTAYIAGLATTMAIMHIFEAAQPALLYLSPACVAAIAIQALVRGETKLVWSWTDDDGEQDKERKEETEKKKTSGSKKAKAKK